MSNSTYFSLSLFLVLNNTNITNNDDKQNKEKIEKPTLSGNPSESQLQRVATYKKDSVMVNDVQISHKSNTPRDSPRSIYSDDESLYTDSEISEKHLVEESRRQEPNEERRQEPNEELTHEKDIGNQTEQQYDDVSRSDEPQNNDDIISNGTNSSFSRGNSDYGQAITSNLKRMSGMDNLDVLTSSEGSACGHVESEGILSLEIYASGSDHVEEICRDLKATPDHESPSSSSINDNTETFEIPIEKIDGSYGFSITVSCFPSL